MGWPWTEESPQLPDNMPDGSTWPKISIVTPSLNQGQFIEETIRSILLQGYPNIEYIIIDGGSTDITLSIIKKYEQWLTYWVSEADLGQSHAINKGFDIAKGQILAWLNSDDRYCRNTLNIIAETFRAKNKCAAVVGECRRVNPDRKTIDMVRPNELTRDGISDWGWGPNLFYQPSCFMSSWAVRAAGKFREDLHFAFDYEYWLRLFKQGPFYRVDQCLSEATIYPETKGLTFPEKGISEQIQIMFEAGYEELALAKIETIWKRIKAIDEKVEKIKRIVPYRALRFILKLFRL